MALLFIEDIIFLLSSSIFFSSAVAGRIGRFKPLPRGLKRLLRRRGFGPWVKRGWQGAGGSCWITQTWWFIFFSIPLGNFMISRGSGWMLNGSNFKRGNLWWQENRTQKKREWIRGPLLDLKRSF